MIEFVPMPEWSEWVEEEVAFLNDNIGKMSYAELAREISAINGRKLTRSAVAGKASRLGIKTRRFQVKVKPEKTKREKISRIAMPKMKKEMPKLEHPQNVETERRFYAEPCDQNVDLIQTKEHHCRWPISFERGQGMICCGRMKASKSYCRFHAWLSRRSSEGLVEAQRAAA